MDELNFEIDKANVSEQIESPDLTVNKPNEQSFVKDEPNTQENNSETVKGKRGRKKGWRKNKDSETVVNNDSENPEKKPNESINENKPNQENNSESDFNKALNEYAEYKPIIDVANTNQAQTEFKVIISGFILLQILDAFIPNLLLKLFGYFNKDAKKIEVKKIKLQRDQMKALEPIADKVAEHIFSGMNPISALVLSMALMYGGNILTELE